ncbi:MAG: hypothetical protein ACE5GN_04690, partial [Waddliaceae bacterium]
PDPPVIVFRNALRPHGPVDRFNFPVILFDRFVPHLLSSSESKFLSEMEFIEIPNAKLADRY